MVLKPRKLSEKAQSLLAASDDERIKHINKPVFIGYPRANEVLAEMEELLAHPGNNRMPNLLVLGRSNNGKTEILREFLRRHPAEPRLSHDSIYAPVVYIQSPPGPSEHIFLNQLLLILGVTVARNESGDGKLMRLMEVLRRVETKVLIVDELNALLAGSVAKQRYFLNMLKFLSNEMGLSIVAAGTIDAQYALATDAQLESRFPTIKLPRWQPNSDFRQLLWNFEYVLPLKHESKIYSGELTRKLFGVSGGVIGELAKVLRSTAQQAINTGVDQITMDVIDQCPYVSRKAERKDEIL